MRKRPDEDDDEDGDDDDGCERASKRRHEILVPRVRTRRCGGRTSANVASELSGTRRRNEYEIDRARERVKKEGREGEGETDRERTERARTRRAEKKDTPGACATITGHERKGDAEDGWRAWDGEKDLREGRGVGGEDARGGKYTVAS